MTDFLVKHFVKNYNETGQGDVRTAYGVLASVVGILCNVLLFGVKLSIGLFVGSISVIADAFNNLTDAFSSIVSFVGVKIANRPSDKEHPFGHGRYEYISAFIVAVLIIEVGITFVKSSWGKIIEPSELSFNLVSIVILAISVSVKFWLSRFNRKLGHRINSSVMKATAADAMGDVAMTLATVISLLIFGITGLNIDGYIGMLVALAVIIAGINIVRDTIRPLVGESPDPEVYEMLKQMVESYEGIEGSHDLIIHNYGPTKRMATIHAEVPNDANIETIHELIDKIEHEVTKKTGIFLVIHMDPIELNDTVVLRYRDKVLSLINEMDDQLSAHDFRMIHGKEQINLIFDVVVPFSYTRNEIDILKENINNAIKIYDPRCECIISVENNFVNLDE